MSALLDQLAQRSPLQDHDGKSGALLEQARLADGTRVVIKWLDRSADLVMQATGDEAGREYLLWRDGVFDRLPAGVGHAILDAAPAPGGAVLVMRGMPRHTLIQRFGQPKAKTSNGGSNALAKPRHCCRRR
jgi:hypothetical protein